MVYNYGWGEPVVEADYDERLSRAVALLRAARHAVAFTGAGISTDSGLPDFRGPDGVWTRRDKGLPPPRTTVPRHAVRPNRAHRALVDLHRHGRLAFLISQNVDGLHLESGFPADRLAELHGNGRLLKCLACDHRCTKMAVRWDDRDFGSGYRTQRPVAGQPTCPECGGRLISSVVNFGDPMPDAEMTAALDHSRRCDLFLAVGSSLVVSPANEFPRMAVAAGARLVIVNRGETPLDGLAHLRFGEGIGEVLPALAAAVIR